MFSLALLHVVNMPKLVVEIPWELESEFKVIPKLELSIFMSEMLKDKLSRLVRFKEIVSKSKLTEEQAAELANEVSESLAKKYDKLFSKR